MTMIPTLSNPGPAPELLDADIAWQAVLTVVDSIGQDARSGLHPDMSAPQLLDKLWANLEPSPWLFGGVLHDKSFVQWVLARHGMEACLAHITKYEWIQDSWMRSVLCHADIDTRALFRQNLQADLAQQSWKRAILRCYVLAEGASLAPLILDALDAAQVTESAIGWLWYDWPCLRLAQHGEGSFNAKSTPGVDTKQMLLEGAQKNTCADTSAAVTRLLERGYAGTATSTCLAPFLVKRAQATWGTAQQDDGLHGLRWMLQQSNQQVFAKSLQKALKVAPEPLLHCVQAELALHPRNELLAVLLNRLKATQTDPGSVSPTAPLAPRTTWPSLLLEPPWHATHRTSAPSQTRSLQLTVHDYMVLPAHLKPVSVDQAMDVAAIDALVTKVMDIWATGRWQGYGNYPENDEAFFRDLGMPVYSGVTPGRLHEMKTSAEEIQAFRARLPAQLTEEQLNQYLSYSINSWGAYHYLRQAFTPLVPRFPRAVALHWCQLCNFVLPSYVLQFGAAELLSIVIQKYREQPRALNSEEGMWPFTECAEFMGTEFAAFAPVAANALVRRPTQKYGAAWLSRRPLAAAYGLIPAALNTPSNDPKAQKEALEGLRFLRSAGHEDSLQTALAHYAAQDPNAALAWQAAMDREPLHLVPAKPPRLPAWFVPATLRRPLLKDSGLALPDEALSLLAEMLSFSTLDAPYAGLALIREACTAQSLARFSWDVFIAWLIAGGHSTNDWALCGLAHWGDDDTARQLTSYIRKWPLQSVTSRALRGIDVLAAQGSGVALLQLYALATKAPMAKLRAHAQEAVRRVADGLGLTVDQLGDRCVPDLDLDAKGCLALDFGPRQFEVRLDAFLTPTVFDSSGTPLKAIPRANKDDDQDLARAALAQWKALKKDADTVVKQQLARLEHLLRTQRAVPAEDFMAFFVQHPLMGQLSQRLLWRTDSVCFRVTAERLLEDADDQPVTPTSTVQLAHPLHLSDAEKTRWVAIFNDYAIAQPFEQLARSCHTLSAEEQNSTTLTRFQGQQVYSMSLRSLYTQGWTLQNNAETQDSACYDLGDTTLQIDFSPGLRPGTDERLQTLGHLHLTQGHEQLPLGRLNPVQASEMLRTWTMLTIS